MAVILDPICDKAFHEWKEYGKSGLLFGMAINRRKCIGKNGRRIPTHVDTTCLNDREYCIVNVYTFLQPAEEKTGPIWHSV